VYESFVLYYPDTSFIYTRLLCSLIKLSLFAIRVASNKVGLNIAAACNVTMAYQVVLHTWNVCSFCQEWRQRYLWAMLLSTQPGNRCCNCFRDMAMLLSVMYWATMHLLYVLVCM